MLIQIVTLILDVVVGVLAEGCLLRMYMQRQSVPFANPIGRFVFALTDWLVLPLRRVLPAIGRWDTASLVGAYALELIQYGVLCLLIGDHRAPGVLPALAVFGLVRLIISGLTGLVIVNAIMSWTQTNSLMAGVVERLCSPVLRPFRKVIPSVGGLDLSPLALLVALQVAAIMLSAAQRSFTGFAG